MNMKYIKGIFDEAIPIITTVAPTISRAIGGPFGVAAGYILPVIANAFGVNLGNISHLGSIIAAEPDAQNKLREIEEAHKDFLESLMETFNNLSSAKIHFELMWK